MSVFMGHLHGYYQQISLDRFDSHNLNSSVFWLSHAHADHMHGLDSNQCARYLKEHNPEVKVYCTEVTKKLLSCMKGYQHLDSYMMPLNIDEPTIVPVPDLDLEDGEESRILYHVTLTAISAAHCPGSAMLLVEGPEGTVLYTGDFRFNKGTAAMIASLHNQHGEKKEVDAVFCDTTFLTHRAQNIGSRADCEEEIVSQVRDHIARGENYHVLLQIKAKLGYENVYRAIYDSLGVKTHIQVRDGYLYSKIPEILETVTPVATSQVHACCRHIATTDEEAAESIKPTGEPEDSCKVLSEPGIKVKILQLSTMWFVHAEQRQMSVNMGGNRVRCCYSFHSSYSEIEDFINYIRPKRVFPNVQPIRLSMANARILLNEFKCRARESPVKAPSSPVHTWTSVSEVGEAWWLSERRKRKSVNDASSVKPKAVAVGSKDDSDGSTKSRASTPELELWSNDEDETSDDKKQSLTPPSTSKMSLAAAEYDQISYSDDDDDDSDCEEEKILNSFFHNSKFSNT